jgi:hypothetical protein
MAISSHEKIMALTRAGEVRQALEIIKDRKFVELDKAEVLDDKVT